MINASTIRDAIRNSTRIMKYCRLSRMLKLSNPANAYLSYITFDLVTRTAPYNEKNFLIYLLGFRSYNSAIFLRASKKIKVFG